MASIKNIQIIPVVILILASAVLSLPVQLFAKDVPESSNFMDMESSVKLLLAEVRKARKSIVTIVAYDSAGTVKSGSGVFIDNEGRIIASASILKNAYSVEIYSDRAHYTEVVMLNRNDSLDIALLQVNTADEIPLELDYKYKINSGERVMVVGKSFDFKTTMSEGLVRDIVSIGEASDFFEIEISRGLLRYKYSKDGPVINMDGKVIGMTVDIVPNYRDEAFNMVYYSDKLNAISLGSIKIMTEGSYEIEHFSPPGTKVWSHWFQRELKENTASTFVVLYEMGFSKVMKNVSIFLVIIIMIHALLRKLNKKISGK